MKITIVGTGRVGSAIAFALTINPLASELLLINRTRDRAEGDAMDLCHASALQNSNMRITAGEIEDSVHSDVIIFTASCPLPGLGTDKTRLDMAVGNLPLLKEWLPALAHASPEAILIMVSNPVDAMAYAAMKLTGYPADRVIGSGTLVDSIRYRSLLSQELQIHTDDIRAYILGEHGDTQFAAESFAMTGGQRFYPNDTSKRLFEQTVSMGYEVFKRKGHTSYGIAMAVVTILDSIVYDLRHTMPVSVLIDGYLDVTDVYLSLPAVIGRAGITRILHPTLSESEQDAFRLCARTVSSTIRDLQHELG